MSQGSRIAWGTIIAGAAIVAGAVLFCPSLMDKIPGIGESLVEGVKNFGTWITGLFPGAAGQPAATAPDFTKIIESLTGETAKKVAGAALIGGGAAYLMSRPSQTDEAHAERVRESNQNFAMKEDMRKMQAIMMVRAAAAGNPQAQAMMAAQGRA